MSRYGKYSKVIAYMIECMSIEAIEHDLQDEEFLSGLSFREAYCEDLRAELARRGMNG